MKSLLRKRMTIATRLLWSFLVMALVPLSIVTYLISTTSEHSLRAEVTNNLRAIADSKANQIDTYVRERQRNVTALARMPSLVHAFAPLDRAFRDHGRGLQVAWRQKGVYNAYAPRLGAFPPGSTETLHCL